MPAHEARGLSPCLGKILNRGPLDRCEREAELDDGWDVLCVSTAFDQHLSNGFASVPKLTQNFPNEGTVECHVATPDTGQRFQRHAPAFVGVLVVAVLNNRPLW